jgi:AcrR family transcriptional regulator
MGSNGRSAALAGATAAQLAIVATAATTSLIADMAITIAEVATACQAPAVPTTNRTRLAPERRRAQIIDAAIAAYEMQPWEEVTFEALAREIAVSAALLRHYFGDRRELYLATVRHLGDLVAAILSKDRSHVPPEQLAHATFDDYLAFVEEHRWAHRLWMNAASDPTASATIDELRQRFAQIILGRPLDRAARTLQLRTWGWIGFVEAVITRYLENDDLSEREAVLRLLVGSMAILRGFDSPPPRTTRPRR